MFPIPSENSAWRGRKMRKWLGGDAVFLEAHSPRALVSAPRRNGSDGVDRSRQARKVRDNEGFVVSTWGALSPMPPRREPIAKTSFSD